MQHPLVRPGKVEPAEAGTRLVAFFANSAQGNMAIQLLTALGVPSDRLGVVAPEQIAGNQGMVLAIPCPDPVLASRVEAVCRAQGARLHRQQG